MFASPLIRVSDLEDLMSNKELIILDATIDKIDQKIDQTQPAFIPNSLFVDIEGKFSDPRSGLPHTLVDPGTFEREAQALGINQRSILVVYDRWGVYSSPRAWWMFCYMGHEQTFVLDGGLPAWRQRDLPTVSEHATPRVTGDFRAQPVASWITGKETIARQLDTASLNIIDARSKGRFEGSAPEPRPGLPSGHIPGASNLPFHEVLDGPSYRDKESLTKLLAPHLSTAKPNVFSCGSGITAAVVALAAYATGNRNISVYDGSWAEWAADETLPIETR